MLITVSGLQGNLEKTGKLEVQELRRGNLRITGVIVVTAQSKSQNIFKL